MPEGLTQTKTPTFSETWPEIDRNGGRLHFGMVAGFKSERWPASRSENPAGINRNPQLQLIDLYRGTPEKAPETIALVDEIFGAVTYSVCWV